MTSVVQPFQLLVIALAGWLNRQQQAVIDYLMEENRVLKEQLEGQRFRMILFGEASLRPAIREYVVHFRNERNHQGVEHVDYLRRRHKLSSLLSSYRDPPLLA